MSEAPEPFDERERRRIARALAAGTRLGPEEWRVDVDRVLDELAPGAFKGEDGRLRRLERDVGPRGGSPGSAPFRVTFRLAEP